MLSPLEKTTLQLLAFFIAPVTHTSVHEMLKKLNIRVDAHQISYQDVNGIFGELIRRGLMEEPRGGVCCVAQLIQAAVCTLAFEPTGRI